MGFETIIKAATANPEAAADMYDKDDLYGAICSIADKIRKPGESIHRARVRAGTTPEGLALMQSYAMAPKAKPAEKSARASAGELRKAIGGDVVGEIDKIAADIAHKEKCSMVKARALAWERNPTLKSRYDANRPQPTHGRISGGRC